VLALVRGDHMVNEIKLAKLPGLVDYRLATEAEIADHLGSEPGFLGPLNAKKPIRVVADRSVAAMADFVVGANRPGFHIAGVNWGRDLPEPQSVADIRNVVEGDASPDGQGVLGLARGIEVGHVFALGRKYSEAMGARCSTRTARRSSGDGLLRHRRRASSPRRSNRTMTPTASAGRRRWRPGVWRSA
jgi:prolyl-tRNA synthetase